MHRTVSVYLNYTDEANVLTVITQYQHVCSMHCTCAMYIPVIYTVTVVVYVEYMHEVQVLG